jgi:WD40 repeat protein
MRRRDFIKTIGGGIAGWRTALGDSLSVVALGSERKPATAQPATAANAANLPVEIVPTVGHSEGITSAAFAPDGHTIISASWDKTLKLWVVADGRELRTFKGDESFNAAAYSTDGRTVVSGGQENALQIWDVPSGSVMRTLIGHEKPVNAIAYSPDSRAVVSGSDDETLKLWDTESGRELRSFIGHRGAVFAVGFAPDGKTIVSGSNDKTLKLWDLATGNVIRTLTGHTWQVTAVAYSPDGRTIVSGSYDQTLSLWDAESGRKLHILRGRKIGVPELDLWPGINCAAFSPDSRVVVSGGMDSVLRLWDVATGKELSRLIPRDDADQIRAVAFSPDGRLILSANENAIMKLWDASDWHELRTIKRPGVQVGCLAFSLDGRLIVSGNLDNSLKLWDAPTGRELHTLKDKDGLWVAAVALSPDGRTLVSAHHDKTLKLWEIASGRKLRTLVGHTSELAAVAFSPDGRTIASAGLNDTIKLWDAASGRELRTFPRQSNNVNAVTFSPDSRLVASGGDDVKVWDAASGLLLRTFTGHQLNVNTIAFSSDGRTIASASDDETIKLWDVTSGSVLRTFAGHDESIHAVAFSPDGRTIASASDDETIKLWDVADGRLLHTLTGHSSWVHAVAFAPDGRSIVSGGWDTTIRRWNIAGELLTTSVASDTEWLTITPEGFFDASDAGANLLTAVRGLEFYSIDQFYQQLYRPDVVRQKLSMDSTRVKFAADNVNLAKIVGSKAPPDVTFASPHNKSETKERTIKIEVDLSDRGPDNGGGIGRIEWRVNGITRAVEDLQLPAGRGKTRVERHLVLPSGTSVIELVAYNKANLAASMPAAVSIAQTASAPPVRPRLNVLAVGINKYRDSSIQQLNYSVADAKSVLAAFDLSKSNNIYESVLGQQLFNEQATRSNIEAEIDRLGGITQADDVFVLYLAGHGLTIDGRYYFIPHDGRRLEDGSLDLTTGVGQDQLQQWLTLIPAFRSILIYDTCEAGSTTEDRSGFRGQRLVAAEKLSRSMGRTVLSASTDVSGALEGYPPDVGQKHGIFTYVLLDGFAHAGDSKDDRITTELLAAYVSERLPELSEKAFNFRQEPQIKLSGAPFLLIKRADIADIDRARQ